MAAMSLIRFTQPLAQVVSVVHNYIRKMRALAIIGLLTLLGCFNNHRRLGEDAVRKEYEESLADSTSHNVVDNKLDIVKDEAAAIKISEAILVNIYGQQCLDRERPYEIYRFDRHWVLRGTMAEKLGGTFFIIIDAKTAEVLRITHDL